jgi:hypothetical protein
MKKMLLFLAVALALPLATAFNCQELTGGDFEICNSIQQSGLTSLEKDLLISDIFKPSNSFPSHEFIYSWNLDLDITHPSNGAKTNQGTIRNAWIEIIAPMPSILEEGILYIPERGKLLSEYNYGIQLPSGRQRYDCKTKYYLRDQDETLKIFVNGHYAGQDKLTSFVTNREDVVLRAELEIEIKYRIKHYRRRDGRCRNHHSDYVTDTIKISDTINAKRQRSSPESSFKITDEHNGVTEGYLEANNFSSLELRFANSLYQKTNYIYKLNYTLPYYVLTLQAEKIENTKVQNIHVDESQNRFEFVVKDTSNCKIKLFSHFGSISKGCDLRYSKVDFEIETDQLNYYENETILIEIFPKGVELNLTYANQNILAKDFAEFKAVKNQNRVEAQLNTRKVKVFINVIEEENEIFLKELSSISFLGYIVYSFLKKYYLSLSLL